MKDISKLPIQHYAKEFNMSINTKAYSFILTENLNVYVLIGYASIEDDHCPENSILKNELIMEESLFLNDAVYIPWFRAERLEFFSEQEKIIIHKHLIPEIRKLYCNMRCFEENFSLITSNKMRCACSINSNCISKQVIHGIGY